MILAEGINVKVLSLPDGDDPDSFAQSHSAEEVEKYLAENETDFIRFKTRILLADAAGDPIARSRVINDILRTIAVIPDMVTRTVYTAECSRAFDIDEKTLVLQLSKLVAEREETIDRQNRQAEARKSIESLEQADQETEKKEDTPSAVSVSEPAVTDERSRFLEPFEHELLRFIVKYGMLDLCEAEDDQGHPVVLKIIDYVSFELQKEGLGFTVPLYKKTFDKVTEMAVETWPSDSRANTERLENVRDTARSAALEEIRHSALSVNDIKAREVALETRIEKEYADTVAEYAEHYAEQRLCSSPDDDIRRLATDLVSERHRLSKIHSKYAKIETERDRLVDFVPRALYELMYGVLEYDIRELERRLASAAGEAETNSLMKQYIDKKSTQQEFAKFLGERIVAPRSTKHK